ncbi:sugar O-acetyltransferase [Vibrio breoganii]|nr:sugar O-acetyltransferase [Vibrio breoganii]
MTIHMNFIDKLTSNQPFIHKFARDDKKLQSKAKRLCFELNNSHPDDMEQRQTLYKELFGTVTSFMNIEPHFRCDYGFNIHFKGFALLNYNCVILDTSTVHIGANVMIGPGSVLACVEHAIDPYQRSAVGLYASKPITLQDDVWLGANTTVCGGVTIGEGSIIGAGSVVTKDIPAGVIAVGNPCKVMREITDEDKWEYHDLTPLDL